MKKGKRFQYDKLAKVIARSKAFERPASQVAIEIQKRPDVTPEIEIAKNTRIIKDLARTHTSRKDDVGFDIHFSNLAPPLIVDWPVWEVQVGNPIQIPIGQNLVLQQYLFYALIDDRPVHAEFLMANPLELISCYAFHIYKNSVPIQRAYNEGVFGNSQFGGYTILSNTVNNDSVWDNAGNSLIFQGGTTLRVTVERISNVAQFRSVWSVGCRLRGFFTQETGEEGVGR